MDRDWLGTFNGPFLAWMLAFAVIALIFLFYFNRLVAFTLFTVIRTYTWVFYRVDVKCQAIQVSLLAGRVFLRGFGYYGPNETILVHQVYLTWQYWHRRVAHVDIQDTKQEQVSSETSSDFSRLSQDAQATDQEGKPAPTNQQDLDCRFSARIRGVEWFVYNRSPAYDGILASAARTVFTQNEKQHDGANREHRSPNLKDSDIFDGSKIARSISAAQGGPSLHTIATEHKTPDPPYFLRLLPIHIDCSKAAMVMGNQHTRSVLVAKVEHAQGKINAHASSHMDIYRQAFEFDMDQLSVKFAPNQDYTEPLLSTGGRLNGAVDDHPSEPNVAGPHSRRKVARHKARHALGKLIPQFQRSVESFENRSDSTPEQDGLANTGGGSGWLPRWIGLTRYLDEEEEDQLQHDRWQAIEYAEAQTIAEFSTIFMNFYWDIPGYVNLHEKPDQKNLLAREAGDINGAAPPAYGLELRLGAGTVNYGPWADRQRVDFMTVFFPSAYMDVSPSPPLHSGQQRISTVFNILIVLDEKVQLRLLTREPSKDWKFREVDQERLNANKPQNRTKAGRNKKHGKPEFDPVERAAGWLSVSISANTTVRYDMDMIPRQSGFSNSLSIDALAPEIRSSVNQDVLLNGSSMTVVGTLPNPLVWNSSRIWTFKIDSINTDLFLLREHAFLIQDLVEDFTLGPAPEFFTFVPFVYDLYFNFRDLHIYLNANELNIIDQSSDVNENIFLELAPQSLAANVCIPSNLFSSAQNSIAFDGLLQDTKFFVLTPAWNTYHSLFEGNAVGSFPRIKASGSYTYLADSSPANTDTLVMDIHGDDAQMYLFGFLIKCFLNFQENYFGKDVHFQTLEEYQARLDNPGRKHATDNEHKPAKLSSDLDVILSITTKAPSILLPSSLYNREECVRLDLEEGHADLRFTNYYMDLQTWLSPISISRDISGSSSTSTRNPDDVGIQAFIDGVTITGHRLFGLPPAEPTYVCNWDFDVGDMSGEASPEFLRTLVSGVQAFIYGLDDEENSLPDREEESLNDVTFIRASVNPIRLWLLVDQMAFLCEVAESRVEFDDWSRRFSRRLFLAVPSIVLAVVDRSSAIHSQTNRSHVITYGYVETSVDFRMVMSKAGFRYTRHLQQEHIRLHDLRTLRTPWLLRENLSTSASRLQPTLAKLHPPASQYPRIPDPVTTPYGNVNKSSGVRASQSNLSLRKSSSFFLSSKFAENATNDVLSGEPRVDSNVMSGESKSTRKDPAAKYSYRKMSTHGHASTLTGSYSQPHFNLQGVRPSSLDVPELPLQLSRLRPGTRMSTKADDLPLDDDGVSHVSFFINLGSGLRVMCVPNAIEGVNLLLAAMFNVQPSLQLDRLQIASLDGLASAQKPDKSSKSIQLQLELPGIAVRLHHHLAQFQLTETQQTYELALQGLKAVARLGAKRPLPLSRTPSSLHVSVSKMELEASRATTDITHAQVVAKLTDLIFWAHEADELAGELQFRTLEIASLNKETQQLAALVNSSGSLVNRLLSAFESTITAQKIRLQYLIYRLVHEGLHVADPSILNSASFISRSSGNHIRASNSWKIVMRLRWILKNAHQDTKQQLIDICSRKDIDLPSNAQSQVIRGLSSWRGWDLEHLESSSVMQEVYGKANAVKENGQAAVKAVRVALLTGRIILSIDPAQKGNRLLSDGLIVVCDVTPAQDGYAPGASKRKTTIEIICDRLLTEIRLELLDAVRGIFTHVKALEATQHASQPNLSDSRSKSTVKEDIHIVFVVKRNDIRLRTRNLKATLHNNSLGGSVLVDHLSTSRINALGLIAMQKSDLRLSSHSRSLARCTLLDPVVHIGLQRLNSGTRAHQTWQIGARSNNIKLDVVENALGLLGIADQVMHDEFVYVKNFITAIAGAETTDQNHLAPPHPRETLPTNSLSFSIEASSYSITTVLLASLLYRLEGTDIKSTLTPKEPNPLGYRLEIEVNDHSHAVLNNEETSLQEVARLNMPPLFGTVNYQQTKIRPILDLDFCLSLLKIDAAVVHGFVTAFKRAEVLRFIDDVKRDVDIVKSNYGTILDALDETAHKHALRQTVEQSKEHVDHQLAYSAKIRIDGVSIHAQSSNALKSKAELLVDTGPVVFFSTNHQVGSSALIPFPVLNLNMNAVKVILESLEDGRRLPCGKISLSFAVRGYSESSEGKVLRAYEVIVDRLENDLYTETASMVIDILGFLQQRFKHFNLKDEIHTLRAKHRERTISRAQADEQAVTAVRGEEDVPVALFDAIISVRLNKLQVAWRVSGSEILSPTSVPEDLVFSIETVLLKTKRGDTALLEIKNLQLQLVPQTSSTQLRSENSALLPEVIFKIAHRSFSKERRLAFQALGKTLDLRLTPQFILPISNLQKSIAAATQDLRTVLADWNSTLVKSESEQKSLLSNKRLSSLVIDADFDGAVVFMEGRDALERMRVRSGSTSRHGRLGQYEDRNSTRLTSPGLAFKIEYKDRDRLGRSLGAEVKVAASENMLQPMFVPLVLEVMTSVKELVGQSSNGPDQSETVATEAAEAQENADLPIPAAILGNCKLSLGLRICRQSFSLTCEPIAKVTATSRFENIYITVSTVQPKENERFFAMSATVIGLGTTVKHVYSREPTGKFDIQQINLSLMNSEHVSGMKGISSILDISPMTMILNVKQLQDFLTFREIWYPVEIRPSPQKTDPAEDTSIGGVQRYYQATAANSFSWNAAINIASLELQLDLGQSVGRLSFSISKLWVASRKDSKQEQNLCLGFETIGVQSKGRMSGSVELRNLQLRTNIIWPDQQTAFHTPLVQASLKFDDLKARAAFDYQTFFVADFQSLGFLLYNVYRIDGDRLLCYVDGDKIHAYCTANVAAQGVALYQAIDKLIQEKLTAFKMTLKQMEKFQRQKAAASLGLTSSQELSQVLSTVSTAAADDGLAPVRLQVNVVLSLNALKVGAYHRAFTDNQIFKLEALDALAHFGVKVRDGETHTLLRVVLGQVRVALSNISRDLRPKSLGEISIEDVVKDSVASRGGTILKVPRVVATMQTWQALDSKHVEYIFSSIFEGKVEVGWNYARISFIRTMWDTHSKALVQRLGKPLPQSAVQITSSPRPDAGKGGPDDSPAVGSDDAAEPKELITAVVNVPLSKYTYHAREPPIIQTPQLRDMGEATPPLEWIGLQRDKLPNLTHHVVIVPLLEFAKEVEDAYSRILGAK